MTSKPFVRDVLSSEFASVFREGEGGRILTDDEILAMLNRLADAEAVVGRVHKTVDGVPLHMRMNFHFLWENRLWSVPVWEVVDAGVLGIYDSECEDPPAVLYRDVDGNEGEVSISLCYSTREAALAALAAGGGGGGM
jgi:hypothetical protein